MNIYLKTYNYRQPPSFSYDELESLAYSDKLNRKERIAFRQVYLRAKKSIEEKGTPKGHIVAFVRPESGQLSLSIGEYLKIEGDNDIEFSYDEFTALTFDIYTPAKISDQYKALLLDIEKTISDCSVTWDRFIFLINRHTLKAKAWLD